MAYLCFTLLSEMQEIYRQIKEKITLGQPAEALALIDENLHRHSNDAWLYYLRGNAFMKTGDWRQAINSFLQSEKLDGQSPAVEARKMLQEIMEFYNKDMYNQ